MKFGEFDSERMNKIVADTMEEIEKYLRFELENVITNSDDMMEMMGKSMVYKMLLEAIGESKKSLPGG